MNKLLATIFAATFAFGFHGSSFAADPAPAAKPANCEEQAVGKNGKPLAGAAKTAFLKKCTGDAAPKASTACEDKAVGKNGKPLAGAAKTAFLKKCNAETK